MGQIVTQFDRDKDLTIHVASGDISTDEVWSAIEVFYQAGVTRFVLWDFTAADISRVTGDEVRKLVERVGPHEERHRVGGKTALVFSSPSGFGLGRMFDIPKQGSDEPVRYRSFHSMTKARKWLESIEDDPPQTF